MALSNDLLTQFAKITTPEKETNKETTVYGTVHKSGNTDFVQLDGSDRLTPVISTISLKEGDRVTVMIKNHSAVVTGNISSPSPSQGDLDDVKQDVSDQISEFEIVIADKVSTDELEAEKARIDELIAENVLIKGELQASSAIIDDLQADNVTITGSLNAANAEIENLKATMLTVDVADIKYAKIEDLEATNADIHNLQVDYGDFKTIITEDITAINGSIENLEVDKLSVTDAELQYANIDFANIGKAAIENFFSKSGMIGDLVVGDGTITGTLVGVTIKGDLIEGGTVVADKLVIKGTDGLYYKLNTDGEKVGAEQTEYNSLNGTIITAKSITAEKISVNDLVAFGATIGGFHITEDSLYSGVKESATNTTRGVYLDDEGQLSVGDVNNFLRYYKDTDGTWKLEVSAQSLKIHSGSKVTDIQEEIDNIKDEVTTVVAIESSRGVMFKNTSISTTLLAVIYRGSQRITDSTALADAMGSEAHLQWSYKKVYEEEYTDIPSTDPRLSDNGFMLTLSVGDIDLQTIFKCDLIA